MGGKPSTKDTTESQPVDVSGKRSTKYVSLLVLHNKPQRPDMINFCRALNAQRQRNIVMYNPPRLDQPTKGDNQDNSVFMFSKVPDEGLFPESEKNNIATWISKQLQKEGGIVVVCLLTDYDLESLKKGTIFENDKRIVAFCFENPPVNNEDCICIKVDFETSKTEDMRDKLKDLANAIKDETLSCS